MKTKNWVICLSSCLIIGLTSCIAMEPKKRGNEEVISWTKSKTDSLEDQVKKLQEQNTLLTKKIDSYEQMLKPLVTIFDRDHDGTITKEEAEESLKDPKAVQLLTNPELWGAIITMMGGGYVAKKYAPKALATIHKTGRQLANNENTTDDK